MANAKVEILSHAETQLTGKAGAVSYEYRGSIYRVEVHANREFRNVTCDGKAIHTIPNNVVNQLVKALVIYFPR